VGAGSLIDVIRDSYRHLTLRRSLALAAPLAIALALIFGTGEYVQFALVSFISSDRPTIYASAYDDGLIQWLTPYEWLWAPITSLLAPIAIVATVIGLRHRVVKHAAISIGIWCAILVITVDIITLSLTGDLTVAKAVQCFAADVSGSIVMACIAALLLASWRHILSFFSHNETMGLLFSGIAVCVIGLATSFAIYGTLYFVYQPVPSQIELTARQQTGGYFHAKPVPAAQPRFDFLTYRPMVASWTIESIGSRPRIHWNRLVPSRRYRLEMRLYADCVFTDLKNIASSPPIFVKEAVTSVRVMGDDGISYLQVSPARPSRMDLLSKGNTPFWFEMGKSKSVKDAQLAYLVQPNDRIAVATSGQVRFSYTVQLLKYLKNGIAPGPRELVVSVDGTRWRGSFDFHGAWNEKHRSKCTPLKAGEGRRFGEPRHPVTIPEQALSATVLVTLVPDATDPSLYDPESRLTVSRSRGYAWLDNYNFADVDGMELGTVDTIQLSHNVANLSLDGVKAETVPSDTVSAVGDLSVLANADGSIRIRGRADRAWINDNRLSRTRWERLSSGVRLFFGTTLIGGMSALLGFLTLVVRSKLTEDMSAW